MVHLDDTSVYYHYNIQPTMLKSDKNILSVLRSTSSNELARCQHVLWTMEEDSALIKLYLFHGPNWELISNRLVLFNGSDDFGTKYTPHDVRKRVESVFRHCWPIEDQENYSNINELRHGSRSSNQRHKQSPNCWMRDKYLKNCARYFNQSNLSKGHKSVPTPQFILGTSASNDVNSAHHQIPSHGRPTVRSFPLKALSFSQCDPSPLQLSTTAVPMSQLRLKNPGPRNSITKSESQTSNALVINTISSASLCFDSPSSSVPVPHHSLFVNTEDPFVVQTPTKDLSEADQQSFHLSSPPVLLGNLVQSRLGNKFDLDRIPLSSRFVRGEFHRRRPLGTRLFENSLNDSVTSLNGSHSCHGSQSRLPADPKSSLGGLSDSKYLAVLTAKATVWNKALSIDRSFLSSLDHPNLGFSTSFDQKSNSSVLRNSETSRFSPFSVFQNPHSLKPLKPLSGPPRQQPQLILRRVLQVAYEDNWRHIAFGNGKQCQTVIQLARGFMIDFEQNANQSLVHKSDGNSVNRD